MSSSTESREPCAVNSSELRIPHLPPGPAASLGGISREQHVLKNPDEVAPEPPCPPQSRSRRPQCLLLSPFFTQKSIQPLTTVKHSAVFGALVGFSWGVGVLGPLLSTTYPHIWPSSSPRTQLLVQTGRDAWEGAEESSVCAGRGVGVSVAAVHLRELKPKGKHERKRGTVHAAREDHESRGPLCRQALLPSCSFSAWHPASHC